MDKGSIIIKGKVRSLLTLAIMLLGGHCLASFDVSAVPLVITWEEDGHQDDDVLHLWAAIPPNYVRPRVHSPFRGYRFHPHYALMDCELDPKEAMVIVDGELLGEADDFDGFPSYLMLRPGYHQVEFHHQGHRSLVLEGLFRTGSFIRVGRELEGGVGQRVIKLQAPRVIDTGRQQKKMPPPIDKGEEGISQLTAGSEPSSVQTSPSLPVGSQDPPDDAGLLALTITPFDASVYLDDCFFGTGEEVSLLHGFIRLPPGEHRIQIQRPGYRAQTLEVVITAGEKQQLEVKLAEEDKQ